MLLRYSKFLHTCSQLDERHLLLLHLVGISPTHTELDITANSTVTDPETIYVFITQRVDHQQLAKLFYFSSLTAIRNRKLQAANHSQISCYSTSRVNFTNNHYSSPTDGAASDQYLVIQHIRFSSSIFHHFFCNNAMFTENYHFGSSFYVAFCT